MDHLVNIISVLVVLAFLGYGSWSDIRTREVSNIVWLLFAPIGVALTVARLYLSPELLWISLGSIIVATSFALLLFYTGVFGGADAKGLICIGISIPTLPENIPASVNFFHPFFPVVILSNSFLVAVSMALYILVRNMFWKYSTGGSLFLGLEKEPALKKAFALVSGYKAEFKEIEDKMYLYPLEEVVESGGTVERRLNLFVEAEVERQDLIGKLRPYVEKAVIPREIWATPGLPMLVFVTIGFMLALVIGDLIFLIISVFIGIL